MYIVSVDRKDVLITDDENLAHDFAAVLVKYLNDMCTVSVDHVTTLLLLGLPGDASKLGMLLRNAISGREVRLRSP